jgi:hypothetical protein
MKDALKIAGVVMLAGAIGWSGSGLIELSVIHDRHQHMARTFWNGKPFEAQTAVIYWSETAGLARHVCTTVECYPFFEDTGCRCVSTGGKWDELTGCSR